MSGVSFAISTSLFQGQRLDREHLVEIAAHGFDAVEVVAQHPHFAYDDPLAIANLAEWLDDTRLTLTAVHAPTTDSIAAASATVRERALAAIRQVLEAARVLPYPHLVLHLGVPGVDAAGDNDRDAGRRSLETLLDTAESCGVTLAIEVIVNRLSTPEALVALIDDVLDTTRAGICLDVGHARLLGDPVDAIETASGLIVAAHVHDTRGARDEHLVPYSGSIDWTRTLLAFQKVGYSGPWTFELAPSDAISRTLAQAAGARLRFEQRLGINDELMSQ